MIRAGLFLSGALAAVFLPVSCAPEVADSPHDHGAAPAPSEAEFADPSDAAGRVVEADTRDEVLKAVKYLTRRQRGDGTFGESDKAFVTGTTGLVVLALRPAGVASDDQHVKDAIVFLRKQDPTVTYEIALQTLALCAAGGKGDGRIIQRNVASLERDQIATVAGFGGWTYSRLLRTLTKGDPSNTEFAIWALDEAARCGARVSPETWRMAIQYWEEQQNPDGGWPYTGSRSGSQSTGSMTCSGIASLSICMARMKAAGIEPDDTCVAALDRGLAWIDQNFADDRNPGEPRWYLYYAMVARRAGELSGRDSFGDTNWRATLTTSLLAC
jgi:hypothetical protein